MPEHHMHVNAHNNDIREVGDEVDEKTTERCHSRSLENRRYQIAR